MSSAGRVKEFTPGQAVTMVENALRRDAAFADFCAVLRGFYRTGRLDYSLNRQSLHTTFWQQGFGSGYSENTAARAALENVNFALSRINTIVATTAGTLPSFTIQPGFLTPQSQVDADAVTNLIRKFMDFDGVLAKMRRIGLDASILGEGWLLCGWHLVEKEYTEEERAELQEAAVAEFREATIADGDDPNDPENIALEEEVRESVPTSRVVESRPTATYVAPYDVHLPPNISEIEDTPWFAITRRERMDEVRVNDLYDAEARQKVVPINTDPAAAARRTEEDGPVEHPDDVALIVHFYDVRQHKVIIFDRSSGAVLFSGDNPNNFDDVPLVHLRANRDGELIRGFGDLENTLGSYLKAAIVEKKSLENLERQGDIFVADGTKFSKEDKANLKTATAGDVIMLENINEGDDINRLFANVPQTALSADVYAARQQHLQDADAVLGLNEYQTGSVGPSRGSGTQAAIVEGTATLKARERIEAYESAFTKVANLFLKLSRQHLDYSVVVEIVGPSGSNWDNIRELSAADITGDFTLQVVEGSLAAVNPATKRQHGMEMVQLATQLLSLNVYEPQGVVNLLNMGLRDLGAEPDHIGLRPLQPEPAPLPEAGMTAEGAPLPAEGAPVPPVDMTPMGAEVSPQDEIFGIGGPPLPMN